ncbi:MAG: matrixin family metalloprotease [Minicystis sp.]
MSGRAVAPSFRHTPSRARSSSVAVAVVSLLFVTLPGAAAHAYCRTSACEGHPTGWHVCTPKGADDCGVTLYRTRPRVTYSIQQDASDQISFASMQGLVRAAFDTWAKADCGMGQTPRFEAIEAEAAVCAKHEYNQDHGNANIILFHDQGWAYDSAKIAVTTVTHNTETGEIYDADMEINATDYTFTTDGGGNGFDLPSVLTHELGHFLGLEHSTADGATMMAFYPEDPLALRSLTADDMAGICDVYPPGPIAEECDATPRHGFSTVCAADQTGPVEEPPKADDPNADCCCPDGYECTRGVCKESGGCAAAPGAGQGGWAAVIAAIAAAAVAGRRRAKQARCRRRNFV